MADQRRNGEMLVRHNTAVVYLKEDLVDVERFRNTVGELLANEMYANLILSTINDLLHFRYMQKAKRLAELLNSRPFSAKELVVKHCELAAKFGNLPELDSYGRHLNLLHYYLIDVVLLIITVILVVVYIIYKILTFLIYKCIPSRKPKKD